MSCLWNPLVVTDLGFPLQDDGAASAEKLLSATKANNEAYVLELIQQHGLGHVNQGYASPLCCQDADGWTPLLWAASKGAARIVKMILDAKLVEVNHASLAQKLTSVKGSTAVHECATRAGEDSASPDTWHYMETAKLLLEAGADPFLENSRGMTAVDNAIKLGNVAMKNLLESKALFRGCLRMLMPAKFFGGQKWSMRYCVIAPRRPYVEELSRVVRERIPLWMVCYKKEDSYQPLSRIPLAGASVVLLSETEGVPAAAEKSLLVLDKSHGSSIPGTIVMAMPEGNQIQVQAPFDTAAQKGADVLLDFAELVNTSKGVVKRHKNPQLQAPLFTGNHPKGLPSKIKGKVTAAMPEHSNQSEVIQPSPAVLAQPPSSPLQHQLSQVPAGKRSASTIAAVSLAPSIHQPLLSGQARWTMDNPIYEASSGSASPDEHSARVEHRAAEVLPTHAQPPLNLAEKRRQKAEQWLRDQCRAQEIQADGRCSSGDGSFSLLFDEAEEDEGPQEAAGRSRPFHGSTASFDIPPTPPQQGEAPPNRRLNVRTRVASRFGTGLPPLSGAKSTEIAPDPALTDKEEVPRSTTTQLQAFNKSRGNVSGKKPAGHINPQFLTSTGAPHLLQSSPKKASRGVHSLPRKHSSGPQLSAMSVSSGMPGVTAQGARRASSQQTATSRTDLTYGKLNRAIVSGNAGIAAKRQGHLQADPSNVAKAGLHSGMRSREQAVLEKRAEAKRRVQAYLTCNQEDLGQHPSMQSSIQDELNSGNSSLLGMTSGDWRRNFMTKAVPLQRANLDTSSTIEEDIFSSAIFRAAMDSLPSLDVVTKEMPATHMGLPFLSTLLRCPLTQEMYHDPVYCCDGWTYEKKAILEHLKTDKTSPVTKEPLADTRLCPNLAIYKAVQAYWELNNNNRS